MGLNKDIKVLVDYESCCVLAGKAGLKIEYSLVSNYLNATDDDGLFFIFETVGEALAFLKGYCTAKGVEC